MTSAALQPPKVTPHDEQCLELAKHFIPAEPAHVQAMLAGRIQEAIEDFLGEMNL